MKIIKGFIVSFLVLFLLVFSSLFSSALQLKNPKYKVNNLGSPELEFGIVNCWYDTVVNKIRIHGSVINSGKNFITDGCHVVFFKEDTGSMCGICKIPVMDPFSPGVWRNGEIYFFDCYIDVNLNSVEARIDYYDVIPESNEENNVDVFPVCLDVVITGFVYGRENKVLKKIDITHWDISYEKVTAGFVVYTDSNGFYEISIPAKESFDEKHTYVLEAGNSQTDYDCQEKETEEVEAGGITVLDFKLEKKAKILNLPFLSKILDRFNTKDVII